MFQIIETPTDPTAATEKIAAIRKSMKAAKVDAYIVPRADEHQGEYVAAYAQRLHWLTGFSGSAGMAIITARKAAIFVDGRYTVQVGLETDAALFAYPGLARTHMASWLKETLKAGAIVGFDPWLVTIADAVKLKADLAESDIKLKPLSRNLVDQIWGGARPKPDHLPIELHAARYAGENAASKIDRLQEKLRASGQDYVILTQPDSIAWLFNIRGRDIPHTPVPLAFALVPRAGKPELFIAHEKITPDIKRALKGLTKLSRPDALKTRLKMLKSKGKIARLDPASAAFWFHRALGSEKYYQADRDPCLTLKAIKNKSEIRGARDAHHRDGVAVVRFLAWLDEKAKSNDDTLDELRIVEKLEAFRADTGKLQEISFDTISGSGPNGAIVHYRVSPASNRKLKNGELLLVDSGAQYLDGTTDITRTVAIGSPTDVMRKHYTLVLKGHIAISRAVFPLGTRGVDLDPLARIALWRCGLDYDHGTGHGVGSFLSVHEGPQSISRVSRVALESGMILSNEPGYYKEGAYGIRIENLVLVNAPSTPTDGDRQMLSFETLTRAPYDRALIDRDLLQPDEVAWIDAYHADVYANLADDLPADAKRWLKAATKPL